jgi:hypothetical protein
MKSPNKMKSPAKKPLVGKQKNLPDHLKKAILDAPAKMLSKSGMKMMKEGSPAKMKTPMKKSKQRVEQDYARNAIADYKAGKKKEAKYEKKKALEVAAGESVAKMKKSPSMMKKSPGMMNKAPMNMKSPMDMKMKTNQDGGAYAAKNPAAPARQLKKLGSVLSKHMKSN